MTYSACSRCRFFLEVESPKLTGECRYNPPEAALSYQGRHDEHQLGVWPRVFGRDWCGEFEEHQSSSSNSSESP